MKFSNNRSWLILLMALGLGGLAAYGVNRYITRQVQDIEARSKSQKVVRVLVPKEDLPKGALLTAKVVATRDVPAQWAHSNVVTPEQFERVENQRLAYPAMRGEMLLWSLLEGQRAPSFSSRLQPGHRAITVPVDEVNSISGMLDPGDRIDLMASVKKDGQSFMFPLLQNVAVLATGSRAVADGDGKEGKRTFTTITLDASPEEAQRVLAAREVGKLAALLRAPGDAATKNGPRKDAMALLGISDDRGVEPGGAPVIYGGAGKNAQQLPGLAPTRAATASRVDTLVR
jgi:pilus assembly protein CpaB